MASHRISPLGRVLAWVDTLNSRSSRSRIPAAGMIRIDQFSDLGKFLGVRLRGRPYAHPPQPLRIVAPRARTADAADSPRPPQQRLPHGRGSRYGSMASQPVRAGAGAAAQYIHRGETETCSSMARGASSRPRR